MMPPIPLRTTRNRWLDWTPKVTALKTEHRQNGPTKPSKPSSVGFEGAYTAEIRFNDERQWPKAEPADAADTAPAWKVVEWKLKQAPVTLSSFAVVTNTELFARSSLEQLRVALDNAKRWAGWSVAELVERLANVGVKVELKNSGLQSLER